MRICRFDLRDWYVLDGTRPFSFRFLTLIFKYPWVPIFLSAISPCYGADKFDWSQFDQVLNAKVQTGVYESVSANLLDYRYLLEDAKFAAMADQLNDYNPVVLQRKEKIAFYINAYNYFAIKIIIDNWPVNGIKEVGSLLRSVWNKPVGLINGQTVTLDYIEHDILRPLGEPRIHFAIVCSSMSCPDLRPEIYTAEKLDVQLDDQTRLFLTNKTKGARIVDGKLFLSQIFDWFEEDFGHKDGVLDFVGAYMPSLHGFKTYKLLNYNWDLNIQRSP